MAYAFAVNLSLLIISPILFGMIGEGFWNGAEGRKHVEGTSTWESSIHLREFLTSFRGCIVSFRPCLCPFPSSNTNLLFLPRVYFSLLYFKLPCFFTFLPCHSLVFSFTVSFFYLSPHSSPFSAADFFLPLVTLFPPGSPFFSPSFSFIFYQAKEF